MSSILSIKFCLSDNCQVLFSSIKPVLYWTKINYPFLLISLVLTHRQQNLLVLWWRDSYTGHHYAVHLSRRKRRTTLHSPKSLVSHTYRLLCFQICPAQRPRKYIKRKLIFQKREGNPNPRGYAQLFKTHTKGTRELRNYRKTKYWTLRHAALTAPPSSFPTSTAYTYKSSQAKAFKNSPRSNCCKNIPHSG